MIEKVRVGAQVFRVIERSRRDDGMLSEGNLGYTLDDENLIVIEKSLSKSKKQVTLLHEILHAIRMERETPARPKKNDEYETWEHYFIGVYENGLLLVLRDNPELIEWLREDD